MDYGEKDDDDDEDAKFVARSMRPTEEGKATSEPEYDLDSFPCGSYSPDLKIIRNTLPSLPISVSFDINSDHKSPLSLSRY